MGAGRGTGDGTDPVPRRGPVRDPGRDGDGEPRAEGGTDGGGPCVDVVLELVQSEAETSSMRTVSATVSVPAGGADGGPTGETDETDGTDDADDTDATGGAGWAAGGGVIGGGGSVGDARTGQSPAGEAFVVEVPAPTTGLREDDRWGTGRRRPVIANDSTASIPVHLLFRDEPRNEPRDGARDPGAGAGFLPRAGGGAPDPYGPPGGDPRRTARVAPLPVAVARHAPPADRSGAVSGARRPPVPRSPQVGPPTRPAPVADPRLRERPGPAVPGWVAVLTGMTGLAAVLVVLWWVGALPGTAQRRLGVGPRPYEGIGIGLWAVLAVLVTVVLFAFGGLGRGRVGYALVLTLFGDYRGSVRRTGLVWVSPLLLRRRTDVRLRHWRSEPMPAVDANGTALRVTVLVVWRVEDTVRAVLGVADHETYLREQVEAAMARVLSQLPADAFHEDAPTLRNAEAVGDALTRLLKAECEPVGVEVYSAQPTGIEYAPEVAAAMQRRRVAALDARHRDSVLTSVVDAVDDTVNRLTTRGLVALDDYERKALVRDLTVAFYTGRGGGEGI
ncbi:SPFH domain-containing protein [Streptomyces sp. NPDC005892]|uniref:SPFH domain-containing protein n=1 Tax=Streptomyces sp. NPDC005892 TaxID=3155593 RepID=UPI0033F882ED